MEDDILQQIERMLQTNPQNFSIIEEKIDIDTQMAYFQCSKMVKEEEISLSLDQMREQLTSADADEETQKRLLCALASSDKVEAFRAIEQFYTDAQGNMRNWSALALREGKMMMESSLLDEKQILISTGMGGKGIKLRYFIVLIAKSEEVFSAIQQKIIHDEFDFLFQSHNSEIETIEFDKNFAKIVSLIPINQPVREVLRKSVSECNQYGDFIKDNFLVTNVKELTTDEIEEFLENTDKKRPDIDNNPSVLPL